MQPEFEDAADSVASYDDPGRDRLKKAPHAYRTISEVADELHVPQHVLRFWETRFPEVRPLKRGGGRRYYRPEDIEILRRISSLLYVEGYTIKGVQRVLREHEPAESVSVPAVDDAALPDSVPVESAPIESAPAEAAEPQPDAPVNAQVTSDSDFPAAPEADIAAELADHLAMAHRQLQELQGERRAVRAHLRDILEELQAIRETLPR